MREAACRVLGSPRGHSGLLSWPRGVKTCKHLSADYANSPVSNKYCDHKPDLVILDTSAPTKANCTWHHILGMLEVKPSSAEFNKAFGQLIESTWLIFFAQPHRRFLLDTVLCGLEMIFLSCSTVPDPSSRSCLTSTQTHTVSYGLCHEYAQPSQTLPRPTRYRNIAIDHPRDSRILVSPLRSLVTAFPHMDTHARPYHASPAPLIGWHGTARHTRGFLCVRQPHFGDA